MATNTMVPYSNPAGNNQTTPGAGAARPVASVPGGGMAMPGALSTTPAANPFMPVGAPSATSTVPGASVPNVGGLTTTGANVAGDTGALNKQLVDIYGKGVGGSLESLLAGMSGADSKILQEYIASLQPQMATAQVNTNAALGAGGVSSNSSVAAIADSNLQAQETAAIAGESAKLTLGQEQLTAELLSGMKSDASKEVAKSSWDVFANVLGAGATIAGDFFGTGGSPSSAMHGTPSAVPASTIGSTPSSVPGATGANDIQGTVPTNPADQGLLVGDSLPAFA